MANKIHDPKGVKPHARLIHVDGDLEEDINKCPTCLTGTNEMICCQKIHMSSRISKAVVRCKTCRRIREWAGGKFTVVEDDESDVFSKDHMNSYEQCPKCGCQNAVNHQVFSEGVTHEANTECTSCHHTDYWAYGRYEGAGSYNNELNFKEKKMEQDKNTETMNKMIIAKVGKKAENDLMKELVDAKSDFIKKIGLGGTAEYIEVSGFINNGRVLSSTVIDALVCIMYEKQIKSRKEAALNDLLDKIENTHTILNNLLNFED